MRVDASCILPKEGDGGFWSLCLVFISIIREVIYIQNLSSIPFTGEASLPASDKSSYNVVEHIVDDFYAPSLGFLHCLGGLETSCVVSPARVGFFWPT